MKLKRRLLMPLLNKGVRLDVIEHETGEKKSITILPTLKTVSFVIGFIVMTFTAIFAVKSRYDAIPVLQASVARQRAQNIVNTKSLRLLRIQLSSQQFMLAELVKKNFPGHEGERILLQAKTLEDQLRVEMEKESNNDEEKR